ncbi:hypothetical protein [Flavobacterium phage V157]|uniref:DNA circulation N-terminal domain-containing protein n=20 Tax=Ficleduovirus TaxID=2560131 RepID=A0A0A0YUZ2_9CAUD|nr:baseplate hub [Flavobacterium phage FCL-2]YP_009591123.1 baseplate hub [Flavobacterium phage FCV-1]ASD51621.1 hypothetical protein [Flavobacterium phage FCV-3]ASD51695.1 hypothetical protein [Flavobacterium phage FCV-11]ASD51769.1 hypothetical protein [Flavobacterium phage V175]ASD51847.1 hypothetical protein [Flavobacterium phage V181]ASD52525.1 hypothetical protein [Flavobacterium phage FCV-10]ASD52598.1 hypothetical protein [Flavobacterium phage FCV-16]ASD52672.1 hypothetical protein 
MSWKNNLDNIRFSIKTGDGKEYFPLWIDAEYSKEYNVSTFDFIDVPKSLVERKQPKSRKYPLLFYFQGDDCIEQFLEFERSADDNRYWTVTHPFYGTIKGQPLSIGVDNKKLNVSIVSVDFWESIIFDYPKSNLSIQDNTLVKKDEALQSAVLTYSARKAQEPSDINKVKQSNLVIAKSFETIQSNETNVEYSNALSKANKSANNLVNNPNIAILDAQALLNSPSTYDTRIVPRLNAYKTAFRGLVKKQKTVSEKLYFESMAGTVIACYCNATVNYDADLDYITVKEVETVTNDLILLYNEYLSILDNNSVSNYELDNFHANPQLQSQINDLVLFTVSNLYNLAFEAQQERFIYLDKDSNVILLTHRFLGLASDENIQRFRDINGIKLKELFKLKKGRKIIYYV